jgi:hypothetical protein
MVQFSFLLFISKILFWRKDLKIARQLEHERAKRQNRRLTGMRLSPCNIHQQERGVALITEQQPMIRKRLDIISGSWDGRWHKRQWMRRRCRRRRRKEGCERSLKKCCWVSRLVCEKWKIVAYNYIRPMIAFIAPIDSVVTCHRV